MRGPRGGPDIDAHSHNVILAPDARTDHIVMFMMTPFADRYRPVEEAIRQIFERPPYCFEVRLARDYTHQDGLQANIRAHISRAHAFIAEVSELNPNVM